MYVEVHVIIILSRGRERCARTQSKETTNTATCSSSNPFVFKSKHHTVVFCFREQTVFDNDNNFLSHFSVATAAVDAVKRKTIIIIITVISNDDGEKIELIVDGDFGPWDTHTHTAPCRIIIISG